MILIERLGIKKTAETKSSQLAEMSEYESLKHYIYKVFCLLHKET